MFNRWFNRSRNVDPRNDAASPPGVGIRVVGVGGGGGNAVRRMSDCGLGGVDFLVLNTDVPGAPLFQDLSDVCHRTNSYERHGVWADAPTSDAVPCAKAKPRSPGCSKTRTWCS